MTDKVFSVTIVEKEEKWDVATSRALDTLVHVRLDKKISAPSEDVAKILAFDSVKDTINDLRMIDITCSPFC